MSTLVTGPSRPTLSAPRVAPAAAAPPGRAIELKSLVALLCGTAARLVGVLVSAGDRVPLALGVAMVAVLVALAVASFVRGERLSRRTLLAQACVLCVLDGLVVSCAQSAAGASADAFAYIWLTVYVALFFPGACLPFGALVSASFGLGALGTDVPGLLAVWMVLTASVVIAGKVASQVGRAMQGRMSTDHLTGALNRSGLEEAAARLRPRRRGGPRCVAVAAVDLDGFKEVNDALGHAGGDRLLAEAASAWLDVLRHGDVLARTGGDEFVLLLPETDRDAALGVLSRLRGAHSVGWSAGVSSWRPDEPLAACLERADRELYAVKHAR